LSAIPAQMSGSVDATFYVHPRVGSVICRRRRAEKVLLPGPLARPSQKPANFRWLLLVANPRIFADQREAKIPRRMVSFGCKLRLPLSVPAHTIGRHQNRREFAVLLRKIGICIFNLNFYCLWDCRRLWPRDFRPSTKCIAGIAAILLLCCSSSSHLHSVG
jgi:hypothetical protein